MVYFLKCLIISGRIYDMIFPIWYDMIYPIYDIYILKES